MRGRDYLKLIELKPKDAAGVLDQGSQAKRPRRRAWVERGRQVPHLDFPVFVVVEVVVVHIILMWWKHFERERGIR